MKNEETGKAVKQLEEMLRKGSDNLKIAGMLAIAYDRRGWNKKAELQYDKVYKLGELGQKFLLSFTKNLLKQDYYKDARKLLLEIINDTGHFKRSEISFLSELFSLIFVSDVEYDETNFSMDYKLFEAFLQDYKDNSRGRREIMFDVLFEVMDIFDVRIHKVGILEALQRSRWIYFGKPIILLRKQG